MDINKKLKQKHKRAIRNKRIENIIYKALTPLIKLSDYIQDKKHERWQRIDETGRNMTIDEATDIAVEVLIDKLIQREESIELIVASRSDTDWWCFTSFQWLLRYAPLDGKKYKMLKAYIYKNEKYDEEAIKINREFTEVIYEKIKDIPNIRAEWIVNRDKYMYATKNYEKTLVISLEV